MLLQPTRHCLFTDSAQSGTKYSELTVNGVTMYVCECGKTYPHKGSLYNHRTYHCGQQPRFACPYCAHRTWQRGNLKKHVVNKHGFERLGQVDWESLS